MDITIHPEAAGDYDSYTRFGFQKASNWGIKMPFEVPDEAFMAKELKENSLRGKQGTAELPKEYYP